jgi:membrane associated rhomboid family serine protease
MNRITDTVKTLLIANVLFFLGAQITGDMALKFFALWYPENPNFQIWQIFTHMFMHSDVMHILFNMFALFIFGSVLEMYLGQKRFLFLYFSAGLGAVSLQILFNYIGFQNAYQQYIDAGITPEQIQTVLNSAYETGQYRTYGMSNEISSGLLTNYLVPMVGASGAIFGVVAAFAVLYPNMPLYIFLIPIPIKAKYLIGGYFALNVISALTGSSLAGPSNTAYWAHIGGAVIGFITMWVWKKNDFNQNRWN